MNPRSGRCQLDDGQSTVELALALPLLALLLLAVVQVGVGGPGSGAGPPTRRVRRPGRRRSVRTRPGCCGRRATPGGLDGARLEVEMRTTADRVRVRVRYVQPTDVAIVGPLIGDVVLEAAATMRREDLDE